MRLEVGRGESGEIATGLLCRLQQDVAGVPRLEDRLHHRLHEADHSRPGARVVPALERVEVREEEIAGGGGLVEIERRADLERHLGEALGEAGALGQRVDRVRIMDEEQPHLVRVHRGHEAREAFVAVARGRTGPEEHRAPDIARDGIEDVHRGGELDRSARLVPRPAGHRERRLCGGEGPCHALDARRRDPCLRGDRRRRIGRERAASRPGAADHVRHGERHERLAARRHRMPLVGVEARQVPPRRERDEARAVPIEAVRRGEAPLVFHRTEPPVEEVGAEGDDVARIREVVRRHFVDAEHGAARRPDRLVPDRLPSHHGAAGGTRPVGEEVGERAGPGPGQHADASARLGDLGGESRDRVVPADLAEGVPVPEHRRLDAARIVEPLQ